MQYKHSLFYWTCVITVAVFGGMPDWASATIVQSHAGGTVTNTSSTIIDTSNDDFDWINTYGVSTSSETLYYGFDFTIDNSNGETSSFASFFGGLQLFSGGTEHLALGNNFGSANLSTFAFGGGGGTNDLTSTPYVVGTTYRLVAKIKFESGSDDTATVWIDPTSEASTFTSLGTADAGFDNIQIRAGNGSGQATYGNIVFATTFNEAAAVPEPSAFLFGGLVCGVLGLNFARKRKQLKRQRTAA